VGVRASTGGRFAPAATMADGGLGGGCACACARGATEGGVL
jgi:hypothetical protein